MAAIPTMSMSKGGVLIIGATGFMGKFVTEACLATAHPTYLLLRPGPLIASKAAIVKTFQDKGAIVIHRFLPSEFGHDVDRADPVEPGLAMYQQKRLVRRVVEESGMQIYGNGNVKAYFVDGFDIGKFTMKVVGDVRTLNKNVHFRPSSNCYSMNELASLWKKKVARIIPELPSQKMIFSSSCRKLYTRKYCSHLSPMISSSKVVKVNFNLDGFHDVEISTLYPDEAFRSLEDCFEDFVPMINDKIHKRENGVTGTKSFVEAVPITASC
ncbi:NmrA-like domain [Sesbania bispinosa]|nr:NmrA-like domain [Sesbania bispinosa]